MVSKNDDSYVALRVAEEANPVLHRETAAREWRSYLEVDCNHTNILEASVSLDPTYYEKVTELASAHYENSDHTKGETGPTVVSQQGKTSESSVRV